MSSADLARAVGIAQASVWYWQHDVNVPRRETVLKLAKILGVTAEHLLNGQQPNAAVSLTDLMDHTRQRISLATGVPASLIGIRVQKVSKDVDLTGSPQVQRREIPRGPLSIDAIGVAARIFSVLGAQGLTASDLARSVGVSRATVSAWKQKGTLPKRDLIEKVAYILEVSPEFLLTGSTLSDPLVSDRVREILRDATRDAQVLTNDNTLEAHATLAPKAVNPHPGTPPDPGP